MKKKKPEIQKLFNEAMRRCKLKHIKNKPFVMASSFPWEHDDYEKITKQIKNTEIEINYLLELLEIKKKEEGKHEQ